MEKLFQGFKFPCNMNYLTWGRVLFNTNNFIYWKNRNVLAYKKSSNINYEKGSVNFINKNVIINYNSYTKRRKLFDNNGIWTQTEPLNFINNKLISNEKNII